MERLTGTVQPYAWGSVTTIPELLGVEPTGDPQAELWLGAHPAAPSAVAGQALDELVAADPVGTVGSASVTAFGPRLPFLLKVLAAAQPLSLQAHPSREQAEAGYAREQEAGGDAALRSYRDDWPKPEMLCALEKTHALCGFRAPEETYALFEQLDLPAVLDVVEPLRDGTLLPQKRLETVFGRLFEQDRRLIAEVAAAAAAIQDEGPVGAFAATALELDRYFSGDPGVVAGLLMNRIVLQRFDAVYLPAGNLHAYLRGSGVEIMANSDNVLRAGLTSKHVDVAELLRIVDFRPGFAGFVDAAEEVPGVWRYPIPAPEFALWRLEVGSEPVALPGTGGGRIVLVVEGGVRLGAEGGELSLDRGQTAFVPATDAPTVVGSGTVFVGGPGLV